MPSRQVPRTRNDFQRGICSIRVTAYFLRVDVFLEVILRAGAVGAFFTGAGFAAEALDELAEALAAVALPLILSTII